MLENSANNMISAQKIPAIDSPAGRENFHAQEIIKKLKELIVYSENFCEYPKISKIYQGLLDGLESINDRLGEYQRRRVMRYLVKASGLREKEKQEVNLNVQVTPDMEGETLKDKIAKAIEQQQGLEQVEVQNIQDWETKAVIFPVEEENTAAPQA